MKRLALASYELMLRTGLYFAGFFCVAVLLIRIFHAISFVEPLQAATSGYEEESLFAIWKWIHHQAIYSDPFDIPFATSYFNWGFYILYGAVAATVSGVFHLGDEWLPTICRSITLLFTLGLIPLFWAIISEFELWPEFWGKFEKGCFCTILATNPLVGFWALTTRPDIAALFFELGGLWLFIKYLGSERTIFLCLSIISFYLAWSFKQTNVALVTGCCLFLILKKRQFRVVALIAASTFTLFAITMVTFGKTYIFSLAFSQRHMPFLLGVGIHNLEKAFVKFPLFPIGLLLLPLLLRRHRNSRSSLFCICFATSFVVTLFMSAKVGASDNYYFLPAVLASFVLLAFAVNSEALVRYPTGGRHLLTLAIFFLIASLATVLFGKFGVLNVGFRNQDLKTLQKSMIALPGPIFVYAKGLGNLPWIQPHPPNFVLSCAYECDRTAGVSFRHGGVGGLINSKYFRYIVIRCTDGRNEIDGVALGNYHVEFTDGPFLYLRPNG